MSHFISLGLSFLICHTNTGSSALEQCLAVVNKYQPKEDNQRQHFLGQERDSTFSLQLQGLYAPWVSRHNSATEF